MFKLAAAVTSVLISLGLAAAFPPPPPDRDGPPPPPKSKAKGKEKGEPKKKGEPGPRGDLRRAYDLLRRLRADEGSVGRPEERIRDWTERASRYYRDGLKALEDGDDFRAHEFGAIAHDLARAADHARNAALLDRRDNELPPPPAGDGPDDSSERTRRDLNRAYERISESGEGTPSSGGEVYLKASRDLYHAARRDVEAGRDERGGELARAAEAMTHVVDHLGHLADGPPDRPEPKAREKKKERDREKENEKGRRAGRRESDLPPPLP